MSHARRIARYSIEGHPSTRYANAPDEANWTAYPVSAVQSYVRTNPWEDEEMPTNGGPYLPQIFPYGQGGRPKVYQNPLSSIEKPANKIKKGEIVLAKGERASLLRLFKVIDVAKGRGTLEIHLRYIGQWRSGDDRYLPATSSQAEEKILEFEGYQLTAPLSLAPKSMEPYALAAPSRESVRKKYKAKKAKEEARWSRLNGGRAVPKSIKMTRRGGRADDISAVGGPTNRGRGTPWPIGDLAHAKAAVEYVARGWGKAKDRPTVMRAVKREYPEYDWDKFLRAQKARYARANSQASESPRVGRVSTKAAAWLGHSLTPNGEVWEGYGSHDEASENHQEVIRGSEVLIHGKRLRKGERVEVPWSEDADITFKRTDPYGRSAYANRRL